MVVSNGESISELTLDRLLSTSLTDTPCVYLNQEREVWVATEMCVQYLESSIDSIVNDTKLSTFNDFFTFFKKHDSRI